WLRQLVVAMTLAALVGSDFIVGIAPAIAQAPGSGDGQGLVPLLSPGGGDGVYGRVTPPPGTTPSTGGPPQMIQRPVGPVVTNICQPGGITRPYQTVSIPRSRVAEPPPTPPGGSRP